MTHVIAQPCIGTKSADCVEVCPVDCIYEAEDQFYIHPAECIDCGACVPVCPVNAIFASADLPGDQKEFEAKNAELAKSGGKTMAKPPSNTSESNDQSTPASADDAGPEAVLREARGPRVEEKAAEQKTLEKPVAPVVRSKGEATQAPQPRSAPAEAGNAKDPTTWDPTRNLPISPDDPKKGSTPKEPAVPEPASRETRKNGAESQALEAAARALEAAAAALRAVKS